MKARMLNPKPQPVLPKIDDIEQKQDEYHEMFKEIEDNSLHRDTVWSTYVKFNRVSL